MRVLVTRPLEDAEETARELAARGHQALIAPLLATQFQDGVRFSLDGVQAILATSANGVRALARRSTRRDVPLFAVGPQTAEAAAAAGFARVRNADSDARGLGRAAVEWAQPDKGPLLYVHGEQGSGAMASSLRRKGFTVTDAILYAVMPQSLPAGVIPALKDSSVDAALFYSPRSAEVFRDCAKKETLPTAPLIAVCISESTASALSPLHFREIRVARAPNQTALLACLD